MVVEAEGSAVARAQGMALQNMRVVMRAAQRHSAQIEKQCGVSGAQLWVMQELLERPGLRMGELAGTMSIHQTTASNLVDALVKKAYVRKARDQPDQRVVTLTLTAEGQAVIAGAPQPARGLLQTWYSDGSLRQIVPYEHGKKHGIERHWDQAGKLVLEQAWRDGQPVTGS